MTDSLSGCRGGLLLESRIDAEAAGPSKKQSREGCDVEPDDFDMWFGEERCMMHDEKNREQVDHDNERRRPRGKSEDYKEGAYAIGKQCVGQAGMRADVNRIGKVLHHSGVASELFEPVFQEQAEPGKNAQQQQPDARVSSSCVRRKDIFHN
jgi:hypothetical protein